MGIYKSKFHSNIIYYFYEYDKNYHLNDIEIINKSDLKLMYPIIETVFL